MDENDKITLARLEERVENWMTTTTEYREHICLKLDKVVTAIGLLPCKERAEIYKGIRVGQKLMWTAIGALFTLIAVHLGWKQ